LFIIPIVGIILGVFQIIDWNKKNEFEDMIKTKLETSIDWKNSEYELKFLSDKFDEKIVNKFIIALKVYSKESLANDISWKEILSKVHTDNINQLNISYHDSIKLFGMYSDANGSIFQAVEEKNGVGHLYLMPEKVEQNYINFKVQYSGLEPLSKYNTLEKLTDAIIVIQIPIFGSIEDMNLATQLVVKLKTNVGEKRLFFFPASIDIKNNSMKFVDYIGIYVPKKL